VEKGKLKDGDEFQLVCIFKKSTWKGVVWKFENFTIFYPEKNFLSEVLGDGLIVCQME